MQTANTLEQHVYVVDDDDAFRDSLVWLLESSERSVRGFPSAEAFLEICDEDMAGCLLVDIRMAGMSGLELHARLVERDIMLPTIVITGHGDMALAVTAFRHGAVDFVEKPLDDSYLLKRVEACLRQDSENRKERDRVHFLHDRLATLTARERDVFDCVVAGNLNKQIADILGISIKTVEVHRSRVMEKMQVANVAELIKLALPPA
ncbi:MAG TPA: response regulator [Pararhizobium sp.]|uniref:response regulator transcription factor n=1 Tax=Pararhizobium sp. TaxID=1977563 RepID=UPI002C7D17E7|nr:response regulator [Pararhizobium sp.]HTO34576.1 response regulator [Pararhizobium sp.]